MYSTFRWLRRLLSRLTVRVIADDGADQVSQYNFPLELTLGDLVQPIRNRCQRSANAAESLVMDIHLVSPRYKRYSIKSLRRIVGRSLSVSSPVFGSRTRNCGRPSLGSPLRRPSKRTNRSRIPWYS